MNLAEQLLVDEFYQWRAASPGLPAPPEVPEVSAGWMIALWGSAEEAWGWRLRSAHPYFKRVAELLLWAATEKP